MSKGGWLNNIGRMVKKKTGGYFLVFERRKDKSGNYIGESPYPLVINEGDYIQMRAKSEDLAGLVEKGTITQEVADSICETVKFELNIAPKDGGSKNAKDPSDSEGINF